MTTHFSSTLPAIALAPTSRKLGLGALTAIVIGSMVGSGVFSLP